MNITKKDWRAVLRGTRPSNYLFISLHRLKFANPQEALQYSQWEMQPHREIVWKEGSPGGERIGDQSWYLVYVSGSHMSANLNSVSEVFVKGSTVVMLRANGGAEGPPFDLGFAQQLLRKIASRL